MGCGNCGSGGSGKPAGCKSNGGCSTGGCNRMNVFDWLSDLPLSDSSKPYPVIEVTFNRGSRKDFYRNNTNLLLDKGDWITIEGVGGYDVAQVSLTGELVKLQMKKYGVEDTPGMKRIIRYATEDDIKNFNDQKEREQEVMVRSRAIAQHLKLEMKVCEVEIQADGKKATFFYTADQRVDFRELIKIYASEFKVKVEMRQIGARQESGKVGGIGSCGRELCCATWLTDFKSVNTTAARYQNLSINQTKLSGQCGRLKCCLNYELDTYMDALRMFPEHAESIQTIKGTANLQKRDIFKNLMWYSYSDSNKQYPLTITRVKEIIALNKQGIKPDELQPVELETVAEKKGIKVDVGFVNDVGQISLKTLEKGKKKSKSGSGKGKQETAPAARGQQPKETAPKQGGSRPQQQKGGGKPQQPKEAAPQQPRGQQPQQAAPGAERPQKQQQARPQGGGGQAKQQGEKQQGQQRPQQQKQQGGQHSQPKPQGERPQGGQPKPQGERQGGQPKQQGEKQQGQQRPPRQEQPNRPPRQGQNPNQPNANAPQRNRPPKPKPPVTENNGQ